MRYGPAVRKAKELARKGPRVAAVLRTDREKGNTIKYTAVAGFMDKDLDNVKQVLLVTPDGRLWEPKQGLTL